MTNNQLFANVTICGGADVDTYLRIIGDDREAFDALAGLAPIRTQTPGEGTTT